MIVHKNRIYFPDVLVIIHEQFKTEIAAIPSKYDLKIKLDITCLQKNEEYGTADSLCLIKDKIKAIHVINLTRHKSHF